MDPIRRRSLFALPFMPLAGLIPTRPAGPPEPRLTLMARLSDDAGRTFTSIARAWEPGDAARCRLCPDCSSVDDMCLVLVNRPVPDGEGPEFSLHGYEVVDDDEGDDG